MAGKDNVLFQAVVAGGLKYVVVEPAPAASDDQPVREPLLP